MITWNRGQEEALDKMFTFLKSSQRMFLLTGSAGTGKTSCIQELLRRNTGLNSVLTAPTNKATRVLRTMNIGAGMDIEAHTIYSLLGLVLKPDGEVKRVKAESECKFETYDLVIVDEGSMINRELFSHIQMMMELSDTKVIFMADPYQLPPVGEEESPIFKEEMPGASLTKVERHDNQILTLATNVRDCIINGTELKVMTDNDGIQGVWCVNGDKFHKHIEKAFTSETFEDNGNVRIVAWRNVMVNGYNNYVRARLYPDVEAAFHLGERIVFCQPCEDLLQKKDGERFPDRVATDEEGIVRELSIAAHPLYSWAQCYKLSIELDDDLHWFPAFVIHESSRKELASRLESTAANAKSGKQKWGDFWALKDAFHDIRPCHAITAHRSQGSTYDTAFVDYQDILLNHNRLEALKCLYVAVSRARRIVVMRTR
jgi:hypothetical protein